MQRPKLLALLFFSQASIAVLLLATLVPPFENSDEFAHFQRVDQVGTGGLVATRYGGPATSGGLVDAGIRRVDDVIGAVRFHPERKVTGANLREAYAIPWGQKEWVSYRAIAYEPIRTA